MNENEGVDHWSDTDNFFDEGCPFCKSQEFLEGPHGGLSIKIKCAKCGAKFNYMGGFGIDLFLNTLFDILTNFKNKFKEYPSPATVSNMDLKFIIEENGILDVKYYTIKGIQLNKEEHRVEVLLIEDVCQ